ncbi:MAG: hypothetical protein Q8K75_03215 [Chlamydiales bacterium]|nr:hypothetical protein [Chlamydiales bacterium]
MAVTSAGSRPVGHDTWTAQTTKEIEKLTQAGGVTNHINAVGQVIKLQGGAIGDTASYSWAAVKAIPSLNMSLLVQNVKLALKHAIQAGLTLPGLIVPRLVLTTTQFLDIKGKELPAGWQDQAKALATQVRERGAEYAKKGLDLAKKVQANPNAMLAVKISGGLAALGLGGLVLNRFIGGSTATNVPDIATGLPFAKILGGLIALPLLGAAGWSFNNWRQDRGLLETSDRYATRVRYETIGDATAIQTKPNGTLQKWHIGYGSSKQTIFKENGQYKIIDEGALVPGEVSEDGKRFEFTKADGSGDSGRIYKKKVDAKDKDEVNNRALYSIPKLAYRKHKKILEKIIIEQVWSTIQDLSKARPVADDRSDQDIIAEILRSLNDKLDLEAKKRLLGQFRQDRTGIQERLNETLKAILPIYKDLAKADASKNFSNGDVIAEIECRLAATALQADAIIELAIQTAIAKNQDAYDGYNKALRACNIIGGELKLELKEGLPLLFTTEGCFDNLRAVPAQRLKLTIEVNEEVKREKARLNALKEPDLNEMPPPGKKIKVKKAQNNKVNDEIADPNDEMLLAQHLAKTRYAAVGDATAIHTLADGSLQKWSFYDDDLNEQTILTKDGLLVFIYDGAFVTGEVSKNGKYFKFTHSDGSTVKTYILKGEVDAKNKDEVDNRELRSVAQLTYRKHRDIFQNIIDVQVNDTICDLLAALLLEVDDRDDDVIIAEILGRLNDKLDPDAKSRFGDSQKYRIDGDRVQKRLNDALTSILRIHEEVLIAKTVSSSDDVINGIQERLNTALKSAPIRDLAVQTAIAKNPKVKNDYYEVLSGYNQFRSAWGEEREEAIEGSDTII